MWFTAWKYYKWREYKGCEVYIKWCCQSVKYLTNLIGCWFQCIFQSQRPAIIMISNKQTITNSLECHFIVTDVYIITTRYTHTIHTFQALLTFAMSWRWRKIFLSLKKICMILRMFLTRIHFLIANRNSAKNTHLYRNYRKKSHKRWSSNEPVCWQWKAMSMSAFFSNTNDTNDYARTRLVHFFLTYVCKVCTNFDKLCTH